MGVANGGTDNLVAPEDYIDALAHLAITSPSAVRVLLVDWARVNKGEPVLSARQLAKMLQIDESTVRKHRAGARSRARGPAVYNTMLSQGIFVQYGVGARTGARTNGRKQAAPYLSDSSSKSVREEQPPGAGPQQRIPDKRDPMLHPPVMPEARWRVIADRAWPKESVPWQAAQALVEMDWPKMVPYLREGGGKRKGEIGFFINWLAKRDVTDRRTALDWKAKADQREQERSRTEKRLQKQQDEKARGEDPLRQPEPEAPVVQLPVRRIGGE